MNRLEWLRERQSGIGASDAPNLVGVGFGDALSVYRSKVEPVVDRELEGLLELGLYLEPLILNKYQRAMDVPTIEACGHSIKRHQRYNWLFASPDFRRFDGMYVQAKTVGGFSDEWGPNGSEEIPHGYRIQVQQEMACTGTEMIDVAALCRITGELRIYRIGFDKHEWGALFDTFVDFWHLHVMKRIPPGLEWEQRFAERRLPFTKDKTLELSEDLEPLLRQRETFAAIGKEAESEVERLTAIIKNALGDGHKATCGNYKITRVRTEDKIIPPEYVPERIQKGKDYLRITEKKGKR